MTQGLKTTSVGSFPKPDYIMRARAQHSAGKMDVQELERLEKQATKEWIDFQEQIGIDILVDGEQYRGDMATYFAELMDGFTISGLVRSYGNRYYRKPIAVARVERRGPMTLDMWRYAQSLTDKPVKGMLTGPYTMADWSFNEYYPTREAFILDLARAVHEEALDLERAGAKYIQIDEPALSTRPEEMELGSRALGIVTQGLSAHTITHICYGDFAKVFDQLVGLPVDQIDLELANSDYDLLESFRGADFQKAIGLGVIDVHSHEIEKVEDIKRGIRLALEVLRPEQIYVDPDCGLKTRTVEEAQAKLRVMVQATREVKKEQGID
ncbi:MAG TPA: methionine synthase [Dehalococcoidia bacterium]|nr:methionine synthase [Dehalococcoidia bacterium]